MHALPDVVGMKMSAAAEILGEADISYTTEKIRPHGGGDRRRREAEARKAAERENAKKDALENEIAERKSAEGEASESESAGKKISESESAGEKISESESAGGKISESEFAGGKASESESAEIKISKEDLIMIEPEYQARVLRQRLSSDGTVVLTICDVPEVTLE